MTDESNKQIAHKDDNEPATKGDVRVAGGELHSELQELRTFVKEQAEETRRHFDVAVEKIEDDLKGANKDEISLMKDQQIPDLGDRMQVLEKQVGVPVGSRHSTG